MGERALERAQEGEQVVAVRLRHGTEGLARCFGFAAVPWDSFGRACLGQDLLAELRGGLSAVILILVLGATLQALPDW